MQPINVAIAGLGTVGREIATLLLKRHDHYTSRYAVDIRLVAVCGSNSGTGNAEGLTTAQLTSLQKGCTGPTFLERFDPDILIEAGPSNFQSGAPGLEYLEWALSAGRHAIVVSKGALVLDGPRLRQLAAETGAMLKLSGAAAAALPALDLIERSLAGCDVLRLEGILNATTNYLLSAMIGGLDYDEALRQAQSGGFAEKDPVNDVEGWDSAAKLLLLANFGLGADLTLADLSVSGIETITPEQLVEWRKQQRVPKLIARLERQNDNFNGRVAVEALAADDPMSRVSGKDKALRINTREMGDIMVAGCGPEPLATAAAALKDLENILREITHNGSAR